MSSLYFLLNLSFLSMFLRYNKNIETVRINMKKVIGKIVDISNVILKSVVFVCVLSKINCDYN
jgi:hypothetical protein